MHSIARVLVCLAVTGSARRMQTSPKEWASAREWESKNVLRKLKGEIDDAELGMLNLMNAMQDPSLLKVMAEELRQPQGLIELAKMMSNPRFQEQAKSMTDNLKRSGVVANFLTPEFYAKQEDSSSALQTLLLALNPVASTATRTRGAQMSALDELKELAQSTPGNVKFWDPLKLSENSFWAQSNDATIGFLRHSEIKHGRVAMAAFIGYCIHENGIRWPFPLSSSLPDYSSFQGLSAPAVWDALPTAAKVQIIVVIGFFEFWSEWSTSLKADGMVHYMRGGKPGQFPRFNTIGFNPFWPLPLFDPAGFTKKLTDEQKATKRLREIQNGRLAMFGIMSLVAEARVPGAVPLLADHIKPYNGEIMAPFSATDASLPGVSKMLEFATTLPYLK